MKQLLFSLTACLFSSFIQSQAISNLIIGTYTKTTSFGIYSAKFNTTTGELRLVDSVAADNPSYLSISPDAMHVYAIGEVAGNPSGKAFSFLFHTATGRLTLLNQQSVGGDHPCYITADNKEKNVIIANYTGGSVSVLPISASNELQPPVQVIQHKGTGPNLSRQEKAHVHTAHFSPSQSLLAVTDLGSDEVTLYPYTGRANTPLDTTNKMVIKTAAGAGPRHVAFHPSLPILYVMEELSGKVAVYKLGKKNTALLQRIVSDTISKQPGSADIHCSPDGKFLYTSNRASANNLSIFAVNPTDGLLTTVGNQPTLGIKPRNFTIHPSGLWVLVANETSNSITVFKRDMQTGLLQPNGQSLQIPMPVCLQFAGK